MKKIIVTLIGILANISLTFAQNQWVQRMNVPGHGRYAATGFSINSFGYVGLGEDSSGAYLHGFINTIPRLTHGLKRPITREQEVMLLPDFQ